MRFWPFSAKHTVSLWSLGYWRHEKGVLKTSEECFSVAPWFFFISFSIALHALAARPFVARVATVLHSLQLCDNLSFCGLMKTHIRSDAVVEMKGPVKLSNPSSEVL